MRDEALDGDVDLSGEYIYTPKTHQYRWRAQMYIALPSAIY